jgi:hypothetical protein
MNLAISILRAMLMNCGAKVEFIWWLWNETVNILTDNMGFSIWLLCLWFLVNRLVNRNS